MRTAVMMYVGVFATILLVAILSSLVTHTSYRDMIQTNLDESMEFSLKMLQVSDSGGVTDEYDKTGEFKSYLDGTSYGDNASVSLKKGDDRENDAKLKEDFLKYLTMNIDSKVTDLQVDIYGADADDGILSAEVTATFMYPSGNKDTVSSYRTIIIDKYRN